MAGDQETVKSTVVEVTNTPIFEKGLGMPYITTLKFPHPDTLISYNFLNHDSTTTDFAPDGAALVSFNNSAITTKVMKIEDNEGNVIGYYDKKVREEQNIPLDRRKTVTEVVSTRVNPKKSMWGASKVVSTDSSKSKMTTGTEFRKNEKGVVVNLDDKEYNIAQSAKRKKESDAYETEKMRKTINIIKSELPADINEIKTLLYLIMKHLGLKSVAVTNEEIGMGTDSHGDLVVNDKEKLNELRNATYTVDYQPYMESFDKLSEEFLNSTQWDDWYIASPNGNSGTVQKVQKIEKYEVEKNKKTGEIISKTFISSDGSKLDKISSIPLSEQIKNTQAAPPEKPKTAKKDPWSIDLDDVITTAMDHKLREIRKEYTGKSDSEKKEKEKELETTLSTAISIRNAHTSNATNKAESSTKHGWTLAKTIKTNIHQK